jgi:hypothetical protein
MKFNTGMQVLRFHTKNLPHHSKHKHENSLKPSNIVGLEVNETEI